MYWFEEENIEKRMAELEKRFDVIESRFDVIEQSIQNLSCRIKDLEDENDEPSHSEGWYWT